MDLKSCFSLCYFDPTRATIAPKNDPASCQILRATILCVPLEEKLLIYFRLDLFHVFLHGAYPAIYSLSNGSLTWTGPFSVLNDRLPISLYSETLWDP